MKERVIVSATTLFISLASYMYSKHVGKDAIPYVMIGGFVGAVVGESIAYAFQSDEEKNNEDKE